MKLNSIIFVLAFVGMLESMQAQNSWTLLPNKPTNFSPEDVDTLGYDLFATGSSNNGTLTVPKIYKSTDSGENWTEVATTGFLVDSWGVAIRNFKGRLFVCCQMVDSAKAYTNYTSADSGKTWVQMGGLPVGFSIRSFRSSGNTLFAAGNYHAYSNASVARIYKSTDGGYVWTQVPATGISNLISCDGLVTTSSGFFVYGTNTSYQGVFLKSTNNGQTWTAVSGNLPSSIWYTKLISVGNDLYIGGTYSSPNFQTTDARIYKSSDSGVTWSQVGASDLSSLRISGIFIHFNNVFIFSGQVNAFLGEYAIYRSGTPRFYTGIQEFSRNGGINIYPNPVYDHLKIHKGPDVEGNYEIINVLGEVIASGTLTDDEFIVDVSNWKSGVYFLRNRFISSFKFVKH